VRAGTRHGGSASETSPAPVGLIRAPVGEAPRHRGRGERRARGASLGLTICRQIVERHGGQIGVRAANGGDNRFYFTLPA
jgi:sensor histidine kinase regulating citrate/malate metabolism